MLNHELTLTIYSKMVYTLKHFQQFNSHISFMNKIYDMIFFRNRLCVHHTFYWLGAEEGGSIFGKFLGVPNF